MNKTLLEQINDEIQCQNMILLTSESGKARSTARTELQRLYIVKAIVINLNRLFAPSNSSNQEDIAIVLGVISKSTANKDCYIPSKSLSKILLQNNIKVP